MKRLAATLLLTTALSGEAVGDLIQINLSGTVYEGDLLGSSYSAVWTVETGCSPCFYVTGTNPIRTDPGPAQYPSPILSASITIGSTTINFSPFPISSGTFYAYNDQSLGAISFGTKGVASSFFLGFNAYGTGFSLSHAVDFYSVNLPGDLNSPFSFAVLPGDDSTGGFNTPSLHGYLRVNHVTVTNLVAVPGPTPGSLWPLLRKYLLTQPGGAPIIPPGSRSIR